MTPVLQARGLFVIGGERRVEKPGAAGGADEESDDDTQVLSEVAALDLRGQEGGSDIWFHLPLAGGFILQQTDRLRLQQNLAMCRPSSQP